jgi:drug/metabolite transporter (DMT)-like permease
VLAWIYRQPLILLPVTALAWSGNFVVGRLVHGSVPPIGLAFWRWLIALAIIAPFGWRHVQRDLPELVRNWRIVLALSISGVAVFNTLVYIGLRTTTAINALLLQSVMPIMIFVFAFLLFRQAPRLVQVAGLALSLAGVAVVLTDGHPAALLATPVDSGELWVLVAVVSYALYSALLHRRPAVHPLSLLLATFLVGAVALLPAYLTESLSGTPIRWSGETLLAIGYVGVFPSVIAYFCFNRGVELVGAARAGQFIHLMPVFGAVLSFVFLGERLQTFQGIGAVLIGTGIGVAAIRRADRARRSHQASVDPASGAQDDESAASADQR